MLGTHLVNTRYEHAKYRTLAHYTCHVYLTPQTMDEIAALKYVYTPTCQALCGVEGLEQTVSDKLIIHSRAVIHSVFQQFYQFEFLLLCPQSLVAQLRH